MNSLRYPSGISLLVILDREGQPRLEVSRRPNPLEKPSLYSDTAYPVSPVSRTKIVPVGAIFVYARKSIKCSYAFHA